MRFLILAALPVAALLAQAPPPAEQAQQKTETQTEAAPPAQPGKPTKLGPAAKSATEERLKKLLEQGPVKPALGLGKVRLVVHLRPGQLCAVPLKNMLHTALAQPFPAPLPVTPGDPGAIPLKDVYVPVPSCDDVNR